MNWLFFSIIEITGRDSEYDPIQQNIYIYIYIYICLYMIKSYRYITNCKKLNAWNIKKGNSHLFFKCSMSSRSKSGTPNADNEAMEGFEP